MNERERAGYIDAIETLQQTFNPISVNSDSPERLIRQEAVFTLDTLRACFLSHQGEALDAALKTVLSQRWNRIQGTSLCYTQQPDNAVNQLCLQIATALAPPITTKKELDELPERKGPYFLLMPTLQTGMDISGDNIHAWRLHEMILSDDGRAVIPVASVLEKAAVSNECEFQHVVATDGEYPMLSAHELSRIAAYSAVTKAYFNAILAIHRAKQDSGSLGMHLNQLIIALQRGGEHGGADGRENNAGADANVGIFQFSEYWHALSEPTREAYCKQYPRLKDALDRLLVPLNPNYREMYCVEITAGILNEFVPSLWLGMAALEKNLNDQQAAFLREMQAAPIQQQRHAFHLIKAVPGVFKSEREALRYTIEYEPWDLPTMALTQDVKNVIEHERFGQHLDTALTVAASLDSVPAVEYLLASGVDVCIRNNQGKNALDIAIEKKHADVIQSLLVHAVALSREDQKKLLSKVSHGANDNVLLYVFKNAPLLYPALLNQVSSQNPSYALTYVELNLKDKQGNTQLIAAAKRGDIDMVRALLALPVDKELGDRNRSTALHWAANNGHPEIIRLLLDNGAQINSTANVWGTSALQFAIMHQKIAAANALLDRDADIIVRSQQGYNALDLALIRQPVFVELLLLKAVMFDDAKQREFLLKVPGGPYESVLSYAMNKHPLLYGKLLKKCAPETLTPEQLNPHHASGDSLLVLSAKAGDMEAVRALLELGVNSDAKDLALESAASKGHAAVVDLLLNPGHEIPATALLSAISNGKKAVVDVFMKHHTDITFRNTEGDNALDLAIWHHPALIEPLLLKAVTLDAPVQKALLLEVEDGAFDSVLLYAKEKHPLLYGKLLKQCDPLALTAEQLNPSNSAGDTPLVLSASVGNIEVVQMLLELGVNQDKQGIAFEEAVVQGYDEIVNLLLEHVDLNEPRRDRNTALQLAVLHGKKTIAEGLLKRNADLIHRNAAGENVLDIAIRCQGHCIEPLLLKAMTFDLRQQGELLLRVPGVLRAPGSSYGRVLHYVNARHPKIAEKIQHQLSRDALKQGMKTQANHDECLMRAIALGDEIATQALLKRGADFQLRHDQNKNALDMAIEGNHPRVIKAILLKAKELDMDGQRELLAQVSGGVYHNVLLYVAMEQPDFLDEFLAYALYDKKIAHQQAATRILDGMRMDAHIQGFQVQLQIMMNKTEENPAYVAAVDAARTLIRESIQAKITFLLDDDPNRSLDEKKATLKTSLLNAAENSRAVLKTHREWGKMIAAFVLAVVCLPVAAGLYAIGFFKTTSEQMLDQYTDDVNKKPLQ